ILKLNLLLVLLSVSIYSEAPEDELNSVKVIISGTKEAEGGPWGKEADDKKAFKDVRIFDEISEEYSKELLKDAAKNFNESFSGFQKAREVARKKQEEFEKEEKYYRPEEGGWRKREDEEKEKRVTEKIIIQGRKAAIASLIKAMKTMDKIQNPSVEKNNVYLDLKASIYREYIKHQFALKNYQQTAGILEKYLKLGEDYEKEPHPHKMLAMCYEFNQKYAAKYKEKSVYEHYKNLKYEQLLRYTELAYGKDSSQYDRVLKKISRN
ncbi:MAG: hypothetical protein KDK45_22430, partial [Leptospiraceae bacterium]|nr:hypothetical protein [Leptospiraceae bacterium]